MPQTGTTDYSRKVYTNVDDDENVFLFHLDRFSRITRQLFYRLHEKRARNLGVQDFDLPFEVTPEGKLRILHSDFRVLKNRFRRNIESDPDVAYQVIERRQRSLDRLKWQCRSSEIALREGRISETYPMVVFEDGADFSSFYLEYYFPFGFFENILEKLGYSEKDTKDTITVLMTPTYIAQEEYYRKMIEMALEWLGGGVVDFEGFKREQAFLGNRDLREDRIKTMEELIDQLKIVAQGTGGKELYSRLEEMDWRRRLLRSSHANIRYQITRRAEGSCVDPKLTVALTDLLMDTGLENEQNHYWRNKVFALLRDISKTLELDTNAVSIEELDAAAGGASRTS